VLAVGKSILDRTSPVDVGALMLRHGGGGHHNAGTCQVAQDAVDGVLEQIVAAVNEPAPVG
jgi:nanoRNase/pAp phosphatase (c-di-AMP/oligoRNAs hydrolase)